MFLLLGKSGGLWYGQLHLFLSMHHDRNDHYLSAAIIVTALLIVTLFISLVNDVRVYSRQGMLRPERGFYTTRFHRSTTPSPTNTAR